MAGYSSSSSLPADVFLSFRGEDTRKNFVCHLHAALERQAVNAYIDSQDLRKGDNLSDLLDAITNSKLSIVVFSENYSSSTWCLKELVQILKCKAEKKQITIPVFYEVDPSHVRKQEGSFAQAFAKHERDRDNDNDLLQEVKTWRSALTEATNSSGWDSRTYTDDAELIKHIVEDVSEKLIRISPRKADDDLVGIDSHLREMKLRLCLAIDDVRVVGIWGMGGIGKTTIAKAVYDEIGQKFHHSCFLGNVREGFAKWGEEHMKEKLRESLGTLERLGNRKVLLVLDDVDNFNQIYTLIGRKPSFGGGSRIIITTRDSHVLNGFEPEGFTYKPELLSNDDALELFRRHAFGPNEPSREYDDLSSRAIQYAHGLPLAVTVLGGFLKNRSVFEWEDELEKLKENPNSGMHSGIQNVLRTSVDALDPFQKNIFLDIACFFKGMHKKYVEIILDRCGFHARIGLPVLAGRALVTISEFGRVEMHDLLQELGREIVRSEFLEKLWKCTRLWSYGDVQNVLTQNKKSKVEGIMFELSNSGELSLNAKAFVNMSNLRLLRITYPQIDVPFRKYFEGESWPEQLYQPINCKLYLNGEPEFHSDRLRVLAWHCYPLKSLPSNFNPKNLVDLDMRYSRIEQLWEGSKHVENLISINLSYCECLDKIPDLSKATKLEKLILDGCISLVEVHPSISALTGLVLLSLERCSKLEIFPSINNLKSLKFLNLCGCSKLEIFPSINNLKSLKFLDLRTCSKLKIFPEILKDMEALSELILDGTAIEELPSSIERLRRLELLSMKYCESLVRLPDSICDLAELRFLSVEGCSKLQNLPKNFGRLESLLDLEVNFSGLEQLPVSILRLKLGRLSFYHCKQMEAPLSSWLSSSIKGRCAAVVDLDFTECNLLKLSDAIAYFSSLKILKLSRTNLESLPASMNRLDCLEQLELEGCKRLKSIPELSSSISYINAHGCTALETVSTPKSPYDVGRCFEFSNCSQLQHDLSKDIVHFPPQGNYSRPFYLSFPGSEIPERFIHQCRGSSVTAQLPPNWVDNKFLGFAICAVTTVPRSMRSVQCFCTFKGNHCEYRFSCYMFNKNFHHGGMWIPTIRSLESNHMFLGYLPWSEFGINGEEVNERCYTEATFEIQLLYNEAFKEGAKFDPSIKRCDPCFERCGVQFFFANNEEVAHQEFGEPVVHSEGCSAEPSDSDTTSDTSHEEQYLKLLSKLFECEIQGWSAEPSRRAVTTDTADKDEQYLKLSELVDKENINWRDICGTISDESDCEIEDNDSSGKRKIVSWWRQKVRVTSSLMQGLLDDGFSWKQYGVLDDGFSWNQYGEGLPEQGTGYSRTNYGCTHQHQYRCWATAKSRTCVNNPTIRKIKYIRRHTCWKTLPMLTHQVRVTQDMGLKAEGPFDGFSWGEYGQMNLPGAKHPRVCYVCTPRNVRGCMAIKEVQRSNDNPTILKITYRGRHTCIQAYTISIGGRGDGRISEGGGALRIGDLVVQSPSSLGGNGSGGNITRLADRAMDDNNVNMLPAATSQDMEHFQDVNHMANNDVVGYPNHVGEVSEGTSDAVVNQLEEEDPMDYEEALDFNGLKKRKMDSDDDQPNESHSISNNNP